ncbi:Tc5 transposase DNA-binding domain-containing protein [Xylogone sp. PMI_703]|nr:Tc5 transposase DNA-binding domain-containing protein [Xylogone sp. PMI_703]
MHNSDPIMAQVGMDHDSLTGQENGFGNEGWVDLSNSYSASSQHQSPIHEYGGYSYMDSMNNHGLPSEPTFTRLAPPVQSTHQQQQQHQHQHQQQLLPLIMPSHPTWPSMLTNPASYATPAPVPAPAPPVAIPPASAPLKPAKLPAIHSNPTPRKTLTDSDRRRMCQYHEENPTVKQTEIGAMFGVERSTVSKVLRQREKYLFPEDRSSSPVKRAKGKFPDIERALANWVRNSQKQGIPLTDAAIKEKARFFATTVGNNENPLKTNSASWLEKFKQKNGIGGGKLTRRASETNISESASRNLESIGASSSQTSNGISPTSPSGLPSPSPLSATKSDEDIKSDSINSYLEFAHSNSQSTTSLSSVFTDAAPSSFSAGPTSPTAPFSFSPDGSSGSWLPSQQARLPPPGSNFQRPRSQTFPTLGIDPSFISNQTAEPMTPKYNMPVTAPSSALDSPIHEMAPPFALDSAISSPPLHPLHHSSSNGSMAPPPTGLQSPPGSSAPSSPTQDDARRALDTLLTFFNNQGANGLVDENEYMTVLKLTEKLRLQQNNGPLPGGLHRIAEQDCEVQSLKIDQPITTGC